MNRRDAVIAKTIQRGPVRHSEAATRTPAANREAANKSWMANSLLAALPRVVYQRLLSAGLEPDTLKFGEVLHEPGEPIRNVYFPINCVVALLMTVKGHHAVKVGLVGRRYGW